MRLGQRVRYSKSLGAGLSGDWIPVGVIFFQTCFEAHATFSTVTTGSSPGCKVAGAWCWHHLTPLNPSIAEATNGLELFVRLPSLFAQACYGVNISTKLRWSLADIPCPSGFHKKNLCNIVSHPDTISFHHPCSAWREIQTTCFIIMRFSPHSFYFLC